MFILRVGNAGPVLVAWSLTASLDYTNWASRALYAHMVAVQAVGRITVVDSVARVAGPDEFCRRLHPSLVGALRLYLGDPEVARELAQETLVRVIERWSQVATMDYPEAWTYRVAFNLARSGLRRRVAERRAHTRTGPPAIASWNVDVTDVLIVRAAIAGLPARQRQAVVLRYFGDLSLIDIAEVMACRPGTVKAHLHQAIATLRLSGLTSDEPPIREDDHE